MHSSILRQIWLNFMAQYLFWGFFRLLYSFIFFFFMIYNFFGPSTTEETSVVEMRIRCIKIGIILVLHYTECRKVKSYSTDRLLILDKSLPFHVLYCYAGISVSYKPSNDVV
jgi:hypothetical protein